MTRTERIAALLAASRERVLVLDGSWGVMIQREELSEADFRAERFDEHQGQMKGNNDILCLTRPDIISGLHDAYFAAGADISETNTFSGTVIAQADYALDAAAVRDINLEGARLARDSRVELAVLRFQDKRLHRALRNAVLHHRGRIGVMGGANDDVAVHFIGRHSAIR